jgi:hypothetical protein
MVDTAARRSVLPTSGPLAVRVKRFGEVARDVLSNPTTVVGLVIIVALIGVALLAPLITEPNRPDPYQIPRN